MAKVTLNDLSKALGLNEKEPKKDFHYYGTIVSSNPDDRTYEVSINRDQNISVEAARLVGAAVGDTVMVTVMANGYATVTGRLGGDLDATDAQRAADDAADAASSAMGTANTAMTNATEANRIANNAKTLAENAEAEAGRAKTAADNAVAEAARSASAAEESERQAKRSADAADASEASATQSAQAAASSQASASQSAQSAANSQASAARSEQSAQESATSAANSAASASRSTIYANAALNQLGIVEDVAGTLDWIAKHGTYTRTTDTAVDPDKVYFVYDSSTGDYTPVIDPKTSELNTYYELDITESQADFIMSHLAVTSRGLWVLPNGIGSASDPKDAPKYKALLAADGMWIYDDHGVMVAKYGAGISFDSTREYRIGDQNTYIRYIDSNNDGIADRIEIKAASISLGSTDLATEMSKKVSNDEVIAKINLSTEGAKIQASKVEIDGTATFNAIKSTADATYDAKGAADSIEIGGRNLLRNSTSTGAALPTVVTIENEDGEVFFNFNQTTKNWTSFQFWPAVPTGKLLGKQLTVSFEARGYELPATSTASWFYVNPQTYANGETYTTRVKYLNKVYSSDALTEGEWVKFTYTLDMDLSTWSSQASGNPDYFNLAVFNYSGKRIDFRRFKVEYGNKATDWTPAPEDVQSEIDSKKSIHTLTSTSAGSTYQNLLSWAAEGRQNADWAVTDASKVQIGDICRIAYPVTDTGVSGTIVYVLGEVTNISGNTLYMTMRGVDTTVIDGGKILTNSITADQIHGNTLTLGKFNTTDKDKILNEKIEVGGRNLYIRSTSVPGYFSGGGDAISSPSNQTKERTSDYIAIDPTAPYVLQTWFDDSGSDSYQWISFHWLNSEKVSIAEPIRAHMQGILYKTWTLTPPANAAYARLSARFQELSEWRQKVKLEKGNKATDWTPAPEDVASDIDDASKIAKNYLTFDETNGLDIGYTGKIEHTNIKADGMRIYDSTGSTEPVASFLSTGSTIGKAIDGESRTVTSNKGMRFYKRSGSDDITLAHIGYDQGVDEDGNTNIYAPYYTFGKRKNGSTIGNYSMAEGSGTTASGAYSHAEGNSTTASGNFSHAEGYGTTASGHRTHAEGHTTTASRFGSHAEGSSTTASGDSSHAEGYSTTASGNFSHAGGFHTVAGYTRQTVIGQYNSNKSNTAFEIGNGNDSGRSNALTVDWNGNIVAAGGLTLNGNKPLIRILEEGTTGNWRYRKWSDERYEAWYNSGQTSVTTTTSSGNGWYRNSSAYTIAVPSFVSTIHYVTVQAMVGYANVITSLTGASKANGIQYYVSHLGSLSGVSAYITAYITGGLS